MRGGVVVTLGLARDERVRNTTIWVQGGNDARPDAT